jgi:hypothetical protein
MANQNQGRQAGDPCAYCGQPLSNGKFGAWCKPCNDAYKARQQPKPAYQPRPTYQAKPQNNQTEDIRANVALKMTSELIAAGKAELKDWKKLADTFYHYKPAFATPPVSPAKDIASTRQSYNEQMSQEEPKFPEEEEIIVKDIPF